MVKIRNVSYDEFLQSVCGKSLFLFGGGRAGKNCLENLCQELNVQGIVDNNAAEWGENISYAERKIPIISPEFISQCVTKQGKEKVAILISTIYYTMDIVEQLDGIEELDGIECYLLLLLRYFPFQNNQFDFTQGIQRIPKMIHYCWFGGNEMPDEYKRYLETWKKHCPNYEIVRWDESNYDVTKVQYVREAYENKLWAFVSDYVRLDVIYQYGGIYFDTDVEVLQPLDRLLCDGAFFGASGLDEIGLGPGFGAIKGHSLIKRMKENYENKSLYLENGKINKAPCTFYNNEIFKDYGLRIRGNYQKVKDVIVYPPEVFAPEMSYGMGKCYSAKTLTVHKGGCSWLSGQELKLIEVMKEKLVQRGLVLDT